MSRRVVLDAKRAKMLQIFHERLEFFTLREIEKIAPRQKGIALQAVNNMLQTLVDDGFVNSAKIGSTIYFWSFPGERIVAIEHRIAEATKFIAAANLKLKNYDEEYGKILAEKGNAEERKQVIEELEKLKKKEAELIKQISNFSDCDPEVIAKISNQAKAYKEAANVWTDNIFAIQSWCKKTFDISEETLREQFLIPENLDYLE